jgi:hypothetical protein
MRYALDEIQGTLKCPGREIINSEKRSKRWTSNLVRCPGNATANFERWLGRGVGNFEKRSEKIC